MSKMVEILGVLGWLICPAAIAAYVWRGRRAPRRGFDVSSD